jgi:hypothetical protein
MQNELFNQLLSDGKLGIILEDGGVNLTKAQIQKVKEAAKEQANMTLEEVQRNADILRGIRIQQGARESDVMNDYTENLQNKFEPQRVAKAMTGMSKLKGKTDDKMEEEPEEEKYDKRKDPSISKVAPNTHLRLKKGDSEADILAKMLNMMNENYAGKRKRQLEQDRLLKLEDEKKTIRNEKLLAVFGYKKEKTKKKETDDLSWLKLAGLAGLTGLGLLGMDKIFEKLKDGIGDFKIPKTLDDIRDKIANIIPHNPKYTTDIRKLLESLKSQEAVAGGEVSEDLITAMEKVQELHPEVIITALNDAYHQHKHPTGDDVHTQGRAADFKLKNMTDETAKKIQKELEDSGITAQIIYEKPTGPNTVNPEGHYHLQIPKTSDMKMQKEEPEISKKIKPAEVTEKSTPVVKTQIQKQKSITSAILKGEERPYVLANTDEKVKEMQDVNGMPKNPKVTIVKQDTYNIYKKSNAHPGVDTVNERNWKTDKELPLQVVKQTGLNLNMLQY